MATRVLGSVIGAEIIRYLATLPAEQPWAYWRDIDTALPDFAGTSIRRQLGQLEDAGVVLVDVAGHTERGQRRGSMVRYTLDRARLVGVIDATRDWLLGGDEPGARM